MRPHPLLLAALLAAPAAAQTPAQTSAPTPRSFLAADVHPSPFTPNPFMHGNSIQADRYFLLQASLVDLIALAYGVDADNVQGGPTWLERTNYDISARVPPHTTPEDVKLMLRTLLAERFHLVTRTTSVAMPTYVLGAGPNKPRMTEADSTDEGACTPQLLNTAPGAPNYLNLVCKNVTMATLANVLNDFSGGYLDQPVIDQTNLPGAWDFTLKWTSKSQLEKQGAEGISLVTAVEKQLGLDLKLKSANRPVFQVASVDRIPTPTSPSVAKSLTETIQTAFETTVIKPSKPDERPFANITGNQYIARGLPLTFLVHFGWNLNPNDKEAIANAPAWLETTRFDITAKAGPTARVDRFASGRLINYEDLGSMLRAMFAERFAMKWHMEDRPVVAYTLVAARPHLKPTADPTERTRCKEGPGPDGKDPRITSPILNRLVTCQNMTVAEIGDELQRVAGGYIFNTVLDGSGLKGSYDFTLSFSSADKILPTPDTADPNGALSVFDAVNRQLGLKLEKSKRPAPVLVIDHLSETPTEN